MAKKVLSAAEVHQHLSDMTTILHLAETLDEQDLDYIVDRLAHIRRSLNTKQPQVFHRTREIVDGNEKGPEPEWVTDATPATS